MKNPNVSLGTLGCGICIKFEIKEWLCQKSQNVFKNGKYD